ncbi:uncharacterized protein MONBRDRAFT_22765 [Monosiga brevicollis MX1]|uniref:TNFR-Cys domain-containing protein n=1 Tax=Monosiga brevicollis TaxID=81824 RepID=A9US08_MONBE|nr:uncharacterized protein MONBRDRAFT_22765 [Monosiga brevicollis MX1]EDQ91697.1 predicted protein [Monosiga brevicollis MX1]|eukprot:XP_001742983.1 hypothetical protein [Monosiga brevicollis MX1]
MVDGHGQARLRVARHSLLLILALFLLAKTSVAYTIRPLLECVEPDPGDSSCDHNCCTPGGVDRGGHCVVTNVGYACSCEAGKVLAAESRQCVCPNSCPTGSIQDVSCACICPQGDTCVADLNRDRSKCLRVFDTDDRMEQVTANFTDMFPSDCTSCRCQEVACNTAVTHAQPDAYGQCSCPAWRVCDSENCLNSLLSHERFRDYFFPGCTDCECKSLEHSCSPSDSPSAMQVGQTWVGSLDCIGETAVLQITNSQGPSWNVSATLTTTYVGVLGNPCATFIVDGFEEGSHFIVHTGPSSYLPINLFGEVSFSSVEDTFVFSGEAVGCSDDTFSLLLAEPCLETEYRHLSGVCRTLRVCTPGQYALQPATSSSNRVCMSCPSNTYTDEANLAMCVPQASVRPAPSSHTQKQPNLHAPSTIGVRRCTACDGVAEYQNQPQQTACKPTHNCSYGVAEFLPPTPTTDRICTNCDGIDTYYEDYGLPHCVNTTTCLPGSFENVAPTISTDRQCLACDVGSFSSKFNAKSCLPWTTCVAGSAIASNGSSSTDRLCVPCEAGTYQNATNQPTCLPTTPCRPGTETVRPAAASHDELCRPCQLGEAFSNATGYNIACQLVSPTCPPGTSMTHEPTLFSDRECTTCLPGTFSPTAGLEPCRQLSSCAAGQFILSNGTSTTDRTCASCAAGHFSSELNSLACQPWQSCTPEQFQLVPGTALSDVVCRSISTCAADQFEQAAASPTTDRLCANCTICSSHSHYQVAACTATSDAECYGCTPCPTGSYFTEPCGANVLEPVCAPCTVCEGHQFTSTTCSSAHDRQCRDVTPCTAKQFMLAPATTYSDNVCANHTICTPLEFEQAAPTASTDRACTPVSAPCPSGFFEQTPATATSDRVCIACGPGTVDADANATTPATMNAPNCMAHVLCDAGEYALTQPTSSSDAYCLLCPIYEFADEPSLDSSCTRATICEPGYEVAAWPTRTSDTVCEACVQGASYTDTHNSENCLPLTDCPAGTMQSGALKTTANRNCVSCQVGVTFKDKAGAGICMPISNCPVGQHETAAATSSTDRQCQPCPTGSFKPEVGQGQCQLAKASCEPDEYSASPPTISTLKMHVGPWLTILRIVFDLMHRDRQCLTLTVCAAGEWQSTAPAADRDRVCLPCQTTCPFNHRYLGPCGAYHDLQCDGCRVCAPGSFAQQECDDHHNTTCAQCLDCQAADEYETVPCTLSTNRQCANLSVCADHEYAWQEETATTDRICRNMTQCTAEQFELMAPLPDQGIDRICAVVRSPCDASEYEDRAPTATSDRSCTICPAGTVGQNGINCTECGPGLYVPAGSTGRCEYYRCPVGTKDHDASAATPCVPCANGTEYQNLFGQTACEQATQCGAGYQARANSYSFASDRQCERCPAGTFRTGTETNLDAPCRSFSLCGLGEGLYLPGSSVRDSDCRSCFPSHYSPNISLAPCIKITDCRPGFYDVKPATPTSDAECTACLEGTFKSTAGAGVCKAVQQCTSQQYVLADSTISSDRDCQTFKTCGGDEYEAAAPTRSSDRVCRSSTELHVTRLYVALPFEAFSAPAAQDALASHVSMAARGEPCRVGGYLHVDVAQTIIGESPELLLTLRSTDAPGMRCVEQRLEAEEFVVETSLSDNTTVAVLAQSYSEGAAEETAWLAFLSELRQGHTVAAATASAAKAYFGAGGLRNWSAVWVAPTVTYSSTGSALTPLLLVILLCLVVGGTSALLMWRAHRSARTFERDHAELLANCQSDAEADVDANEQRYNNPLFTRLTHASEGADMQLAPGRLSEGNLSHRSGRSLHRGSGNYQPPQPAPAWEEPSAPDA